jgi:hypothetical protein
MANSITYQDVFKRVAELKFRVNEKSREGSHLSKPDGGTGLIFYGSILTRKKGLLIVRTSFE